MRFHDIPATPNANHSRQVPLRRELLHLVNTSKHAQRTGNGTHTGALAAWWTELVTAVNEELGLGGI